MAMKPAVLSSSLPFLARLAPAALSAAPSVRAALPSRFDSKGSAETLVEQVVETPAEDRRPARPAPSAAEPASEAVSPTVTATAPSVTPKQMAVMQTVARLDPREQRVSIADTPQVPAGASPLSPGAAPLPPVDSPGSPASFTRYSPREEPSRLPSGKPSLTASPEGFAQWSRPAVDVPPPLRESTVAQRATSDRAERQDVVHVTIDRIDLRLPSAGTPEHRANPRTRPATSVSLGDYLRQRDKPRQGGNGS
jgi:hypothetical protein